MKDELQDLSAIEQIQRLKAEYFRLVDLKEWDEWGRLFTRDLKYFSGLAPEPRFVTAVELVSYVSKTLADAQTHHAGSLREIDVTSSRSARAVWAMRDSIDSPTTGHFQGVGCYHETYVLDEKDEWKISSIRLVRGEDHD